MFDLNEEPLLLERDLSYFRPGKGVYLLFVGKYHYTHSSHSQIQFSIILVPCIVEINTIQIQPLNFLQIIVLCIRWPLATDYKWSK
jgi:hypothetical protein